ncbi:MAG TPA: DNA polymerase I [Candidatus Paceibacterota bacterium]|uniref:DNA-directed DNA polymerase n=1 Tax=Candidatus Giovannonibacteria bacterium RIFCSPLOWO2_01_FULL_46_32 TaxID=1798353 RepID=A0A1F5XGE4_9BACT|nr:MAG: hypothetical protein A3B19_00500 [Candidatus Giovannonibacteria bacterium RIFCSPLOWO2_01_FULL_46_32]
MKNEKKKTLVILDAHALIHRSYHALPSFTSPSGEPMGAVYGVSAVLLKLFRELKPTHIAAAFDTEEPTFRHVAYENYKATRPETKSELVPQFEKVKKLFQIFGIPVLETPGFEADDIIGTLVERFKNERDLSIIIASGDMDTLQLVEGERVCVFTLRKGIEDTILYDEKKVEERFGFPPRLIPDFKGLKGDPSDNIIGVKGIGEKTATELIRHYGGIEEMYGKLKSEREHPPWLKERVLKLVLDNEEEALFSKELALIRRDAPASPSIKDLEYNSVPVDDIARLFRAYHFPSLLHRLDEFRAPGEKENAHGKTPTLFAKNDLPELEKKTTLALYEDNKKIFVGDGENTYEISPAASEKLAVVLRSKNNSVAHKAKDIFRSLGFEFPVSFDTAIAAWLLNPERRDFDLDDCIREEFHTPPSSRLGGLLLLKNSYEKKLSKDSRGSIFLDFEMPLIPILSRMERVGILLDAGRLTELEKKVARELGELEKEIWRLAGGEFDVGSPKQLSEILFGKLKLSVKGIRKTGTKNISTQFSELVKLRDAHPIIDLLIRYRELSKLSSTYATVLPGLMGPDGRIHTTFNQTGTATGRLSSSNPNLQNIPIKTELGREIRRAFVAEQGYELVSFDYSQLELRIAAALSSDERLVKAFKNGEDVHTQTASIMFKVPVEKVTPEMRRRAKTVNFGILYGMGARALAAGMKVSYEEAEQYLREYLIDFPGIQEYRERVVAEGRKNGYVSTLFGRRRYLPNLKSRFEYVRGEAERMAINAPIQGTEADLIKRAMIEIARSLDVSDNPQAIRLLLQVHDELLFEIRTDAVSDSIPIIRKIMERVPEMPVPIVVDVKQGLNWQDMSMV